MNKRGSYDQSPMNTRRYPTKAIRWYRAATAFLFGCSLFLTQCSSENRPVKNVVLFIGDGMGPAYVTLARIATVGAEGQLALDRMPVAGRSKTYSLESYYTDSAAGATAMATGRKAHIGAISMLKDSTVLNTILETARDVGKRTGLITTTRITHATPACFAAHRVKRGEEEEIAADLFASKVDVLLGGGRRYFLPDSLGGSRSDGRNLIAEFEAAGYAYVATRDELAETPGDAGHLLGLFNPSHFTYVLDREEEEGGADEPALAEMTRKAMDILSRGDRGFFAVIEGGLVDHAGHDHDAAGVVAEMKEFDDALAVARQFAERDGETLIVVTADHETSGLTLSNLLDPKVLARQSASCEFIAKQAWAGEALLDQTLARYSALGRLTAPELHLLRPSTNGRRPDEVELGTVLSARGGVTFIPNYHEGIKHNQHTCVDVPVYAFGPGSTAFSGTMDNTEIATKIAGAMGVVLGN